MRRQTKLEKRRNLVIERENHVKKLQAEYRANIAQLSQSYASAAVERVNPSAFRADVKEGRDRDSVRESKDRERYKDGMSDSKRDRERQLRATLDRMQDGDSSDDIGQAIASRLNSSTSSRSKYRS